MGLSPARDKKTGPQHVTLLIKGIHPSLFSIGKEFFFFHENKSS